MAMMACDVNGWKEMWVHDEVQYASETAVGQIPSTAESSTAKLHGNAKSGEPI